MGVAEGGGGFVLGGCVFLRNVSTRGGFFVQHEMCVKEGGACYFNGVDDTLPYFEINTSLCVVNFSFHDAGRKAVIL